MTGFRIDLLVVTGKDIPSARIEFVDGCNIVLGPSNTGKTFIVDAIDYLLGGADIPEEITEAKGYETAYLQITTRETTPRTVVLNRGLRGGGCRMTEGSYSELTEKTEWKTLGQKHSKRTTATVSALLLKFASYEKSQIRTNRFNELSELSYRMIAHFFVIKEERIFQKDSPIFPESGYQRTRARSAFNFLISGFDDASLIKRDRDESAKAGEAARRRVLETLITDAEAKATELPISVGIEESLQLIESVIYGLNKELQPLLEEVRDYESRRQHSWGEMHNFGSRRIVVHELLIRFRLLQEQYESDIERLDFILEGNDIFSRLETIPCPLCGLTSDFSNQMQTFVNSDGESVEIAIACQKEATKIVTQLSDLSDTISELELEDRKLIESVAQTRSSLDEFDRFIREKLAPRISGVQALLSDAIAKQREVLHAQFLADQLSNLRQSLASEDETAEESEDENVQIFNTNSLYEFCEELRSVLSEWNYPDIGPIHFDTRYKVSDVVIAGKPRRANGKGVRALTHAAFAISLMNHCSEKSLPHPHMLVIDSPLTTYKQSTPREHGDEVPVYVQESFYESLAQTSKNEQIIVIENDNKSPSLLAQRQMHVVRFYGDQSSNGRRGFFP